jgi:hypothetical protein
MIHRYYTLVVGLMAVLVAIYEDCLENINIRASEISIAVLTTFDTLHIVEVAAEEAALLLFYKRVELENQVEEKMIAEYWSF